MIFNVHYCFLLLLLTAPVVLAPEQVRRQVDRRLRLRPPDPAPAPVPVAGD